MKKRWTLSFIKRVAPPFCFSCGECQVKMEGGKSLMPFLLEVTEALQILNDYDDIFTASNPVLYVLRIIGWGLLSFFKWLLDALLSVLSSAFSILNFSESSHVSEFLAAYKGVLIPLMTLTLIIIGILMILGSDQVKGSKVLQNIALGISILVLLPTLTSWLNSLTLGYADIEKSAMEKGANDILAQNTYDLQYIFQDETYGDRYSQKNNFIVNGNTDAIWKIDINEQIIANDDDVYAGPNDVFAKTYDPAFPEIEKEIKPTKLIVQVDFLTSWYYRYSVDMLPVMLIYIVYCVVIISTIFKCVRLAYEVVVHQLLAAFLAVTDLVTGQRIKQVLSSLLSTYFVLMYAITAIVLFNIFTQWVLTQSYGTFESAVFIAAVAMAVIDGPVLIQRIFGIDAGIRSGFHALFAGWAAAKTAAHAAKTAGSAVSRLSNRSNTSAKESSKNNNSNNNQSKQATAGSNSSADNIANSNYPGHAASPDQSSGTSIKSSAAAETANMPAAAGNKDTISDNQSKAGIRNSNNDSMADTPEVDAAETPAIFSGRSADEATMENSENKNEPTEISGTRTKQTADMPLNTTIQSDNAALSPKQSDGAKKITPQSEPGRRSSQVNEENKSGQTAVTPAHYQSADQMTSGNNETKQKQQPSESRNVAQQVNQTAAAQKPLQGTDRPITRSNDIDRSAASGQSPSSIESGQISTKQSSTDPVHQMAPQATSSRQQFTVPQTNHTSVVPDPLPAASRKPAANVQGTDRPITRSNNIDSSAVTSPGNKSTSNVDIQVSTNEDLKKMENNGKEFGETPKKAKRKYTRKKKEGSDQK